MIDATAAVVALLDKMRPLTVLALTVERNPTAAWTAQSRADCLELLLLRNAFIHFIITGQQVHTLTGEDS